LRASATVPKLEDRTDAALYVAVYENRLANKVTAARTAAPRSTTTSWSANGGPIALDRAGATELVRKPAARGLANGGVAAFVRSRRTGEVLQALALPACKG
jgi:hypothetical protein